MLAFRALLEALEESIGVVLAEPAFPDRAVAEQGRRWTDAR
ncbi:MAG: hypothetical protein R3F11_00965 [Verrucomicrobiales bacterium]